ncbi:MAG: DNA repair exonuclease [Clostridia bacterium]|nr:DNA repair exonuclease [Clostridia bacterium]
MSAVKILHCGDLHIGASESFLEERASGRRMEALLTFERIVDTAVKEEVELVLISGDLFDSNRIENLFFERVMEKAASADNIAFVYAAGNHDPLNFESPFIKTKLPSNFHVLPTKDSCITIRDGLKVYGRSFSEILQKGEDKFSVEADENCVNIMCIHGEYGFGGEQNPISNDFIISSKMDYIALGHVHQRTEPKRIGNTYIAYCGCPEGLGFDEQGVKGVYVGEIDKNRCDLHFVPTCKRMHIVEKTDVSGLDDTTAIFEKCLSDIKEKYGESFGENLYKIVLTGETAPDISINIAELTERFKSITYFTKISDKTTLKFDIEELKNETSLKGVFVEKMLERIENEPENAAKLQAALKIGLKAFSGEVDLLENQ